MVAVTSNLLGIGIYTISEAAVYARVRTQLLTRWLHASGGPAVIQPQLGSDRRYVTFLDFVQALAIREIRSRHGVPLGKIREAYEQARTKYGVEYPFAMAHTTYLFGDDGAASPDNRPRRYRQEIVISLGDDKLLQLTGKERGNHMIAKVAELYLKDLTFGADGIADRYVAFRLGVHEVTMDPHRHFGEPILDSCGYTAQTLFESYLAEGSIEAASRAYGVTPEEIEIAIRYFDYLQKPTAA